MPNDVRSTYLKEKINNERSKVAKEIMDKYTFRLAINLLFDAEGLEEF